MELIIIITLVLLYFLMQSVELASFGSRVAGRMSVNLALGTTVHHTMYVGSRFFLVPFLPLLAYTVESGIGLSDYFFIVMISLSSALVMSILVLNKINFLQLFFQRVFRENITSYLPNALIKALIKSNKKETNLRLCENFEFKKISIKKVIFSFIAYSFLVTSFFIAFSLAILFPHYQLTLSQSTSVFHGFGSVILAFYLDPMLSRSIDRLDDESGWVVNAYSILLGRVLSYLVSAAIFTVLYFIY